ncbi:cyclase family protein [Paractinoplanes atraurantiacus]|uniref:Kynurenine formamidase n=1 Tax=Paractinoplanes atraurantiacus TaxID=1036182 RepID=A0A285IMY7_9ACTN|nr:cyclase family protein [Actinoplanes atraurantiacus]SNY49097.1 Kynurenine formamidase [Actinoplanes atraurantiacus]
MTRAADRWVPPRLISLSHVNDPETTVVYPGDPAFELETVATIAEDGFYMRFVSEAEHTGTHWGAPGHFSPGHPLADDLDLEDLCLPAVRIDVREQCARDADYEVTIADVEEWERRHGRIPDESMVIIWTGWEQRWGTEAFLNRDADGVLHQPGFALATVRWLIDTGRLGRRGGTGTDTFGPDPGRDSGLAVSRLVYQEHRISLEVLANLAELPPTGAYILCGGQINKAGSGSTALIYGLLPPG